MNARQWDMVIVGGGLAGGLIAAALAAHRPHMGVQLVEAGPAIGGNHRWSWFASDLSPAGNALLAPFRKNEWDDGYEVHFPALKRRLRTGYRSLASPDFEAGIRRILPESAIRLNRQVAAMDAHGVTLADGERIPARCVLDCRGLAPSRTLTGGWQVFMGRHVRTSEPHHVTRPVIMDATVPQLDGYRFVYVLPLGSHEIFVEDTYYNDGPELDRSALSARLDQYCNQYGWTGEFLGSETGVLPVVTGGDFAAFQAEQRIDGVARAGARGGFQHPLTSYSLPIAVEAALAIAREADLPGDQLAAFLEARAQRFWRQTGFYRRLGTILFGAAQADERFRVFQRFYGLNEGLIERFYAGRSTRFDRARVQCGRPPVPISRALGALARPGRPLVKEPAA